MTNRKIFAALGAVLLALVFSASLVVAHPASPAACDCKTCGDSCRCETAGACKAGPEKACDCSQCGDDCKCACAGACQGACDADCKCDCGDNCKCADGCKCGCSCKQAKEASQDA